MVVFLIVDAIAGHGFGYGNRIKIHLPHEHYQAGFNQIIANGVAVKLAERDRGVNTDLLFIPSGVHAIVSLKVVKFFRPPKSLI